MDSYQNASIGSNHQNHKLPKHKATWSYELHKTFVDLCHGQIRNKQGIFFSKVAWNKIITDFNMRHGKDYDKKQMKNHWDNTKAEWKIWYKLKDFESGLGWDDEKNTITASDEWWKDYIQANPDAHKFRFKGIDHAHKLTDLFLEGMATGKFAWAPSQGSLPTDSAGPCEVVESNGKQKVVDLDSDSQVQIDEPGIVDLNDDTTDFENNKRQRRGKRNVDIIPPPGPRKRASSTVVMDKHLDRICGALESVANRPKPEPKQEVTIKECVKLLDQLEEVVKGSELYLFACELFMIKEQREMFEALDASIHRAWLESKKNKPPNN